MGFFTDTTVCIGCKACEVACKQWNDLPSDGGEFRKGGSYDHTGGLSGSTWRHVRFVETLTPATATEVDSDVAAADCTPRRRRRGVRQLDVHVRRLQALHERRLPGRLPDRRADPHRVRDRGAAARHLQRLRLLHPVLPVRRGRPRAEDGRAAKCTLCYDRLEDGLEPACAKACPTDSIQFGPYDELVEVASRRVAALHERGVEGAYLYGAADDAADELAGGLGAFFLLTEQPERFGLPAQADSPIQENLVPATIAAMGAGLLAAAGVAAAFLWEKAR